MYKAYLRRYRNKKVLMEEAQFAPPTEPDTRNQSGIQMQTRYQAQPMVRTRTYRNPRQGASTGEAQTTTVVNGVIIRPPPPQTQSRPQIQPQQNVVANAHEGVPRHAANRGRQQLLEFEYQNGWLIWRNIETREHFVLHEMTIMVSTLLMRLCLCLTESCGFVSTRQRKLETCSPQSHRISLLMEVVIDLLTRS